MNRPGSDSMLVKPFVRAQGTDGARLTPYRGPRVETTRTRDTRRVMLRRQILLASAILVSRLG